MSKCTITILDEVNVRITGLDLDTRKSLVKKFKYEIPGARYQPAFKLGRWDGTVSFFGLGGSTYLSMLEPVINELVREKYEIGIEDLRNSTALEFTQVANDYWSEITWPAGHVCAGQPIVLRDYQVEAINNFIANPQGMQVIPTGAGKTIITATIADIASKYGRTITIVPNKSLVEQTEEDFLNCNLDVGVYYGDRKDLGKTHTICTWQSLNSLEKRDEDGEALTLAQFLDGVNCVIVDECHSAKADKLQNILTKFLPNAAIRWGLTGTIPKEEINVQRLRASLGDVINRITAKELQETGILSNLHVNIIQTAEWKEFRSYQEELKYLVTDSTRMSFIAKKIAEISKTGNTLVLVDRIEAGKYLQVELSTLFSLLNDRPDVAFISGEVKTKDRKEEYDEVKTSNNKTIIATYGVAAVGINIPRIFNLVLLEPGKSFVRVIQSIGRGVRRAADKDFVNVFDITAATKYAKRHLTERKKFYKDSEYPFTIEKVKY